jgi:hypothetical protein
MAQCQITRSDISYPPTDIKLRTVANENGIKNTLVSVQPANTSQQHPSDHITSVHIINAGQVVQMRLQQNALGKIISRWPLTKSTCPKKIYSIIISSQAFKAQRLASWKKE